MDRLQERVRERPGGGTKRAGGARNAADEIAQGTGCAFVRLEKEPSERRLVVVVRRPGAVRDMRGSRGMRREQCKRR